jgi:two-component system, NarL family, invasion response regulator UvrY
VAVRVLIVDDLPPFRRVAKAVIDASDGFETVGEAGSGEEAVMVSSLLRPDLVLMDVNLPGIDGLEATRRIRSQQRAPVVLLLSTWEVEDRGVVVQCGAAEYITKSRFDPDLLALAWRRAVDEHQPDPSHAVRRAEREPTLFESHSQISIRMWESHEPEPNGAD